MNKTSPLVSVIIPSYNHEKYIEDAIRSVWNQTYSNVELIVLDDGSKDKSSEIIKELEKISPIPMKVILKENEGICKTLNRGLEYVYGKYVAFLASDDVYYSNKFLIHVSELEKPINKNFAGCYGDYNVVDESGIILNSIVKSNMNSENQFLSILEDKYQATLVGSTFHTKIVKNLEFDPKLFFEDWDFFFRLSQDNSMLYVPGVCYKYRKLDTGANRNMSKMFEAREQIFEKYKNDSMVIEYGINLFKAQTAMANARNLFYINDFLGSRAWIRKAFFLNPWYVMKNTSFIVKVLMGSSFNKVARKIKNKLF